MSKRRATAEKIDQPEGLGFWDIRRGQCHWPLTDEPSIHDFRYCGAKTLAGTSWCEQHARLAYQGANRPGNRRPSRLRKINSVTAVLIGHAPHRTKKGENGLETQPALSGSEALEEGSVRQSSGSSEGLPQQGAPPPGHG